MSKRLGGIIGCKDQISSWHLNGFPDGSILDQQYNVGKKPTVKLTLTSIAVQGHQTKHWPPVTVNILHFLAHGNRRFGGLS